MKKIVCLGDPFTSPVTKGSGDYRIGIALGEAPSANVVVSLASNLGRFTVTPSLTFTTANWFTFQEAVIAAPTDGIVHKLRYDLLNMTCAGGGYDQATLALTVSISDDTNFRNFQGTEGWIGPCFKGSHDLAGTRQKLIDNLFNGNGIPAGYSLISSNTYSSPSGISPHAIAASNFPDSAYSTIYKWVFRNFDADGYTYDGVIYLVRSSTPVNKLFVALYGSTEGWEIAVAKMLAKGYDVLIGSYLPWNKDNTTNHPTISLLQPVSTQHLFVSEGVERPGFNSMQLFIKDKLNGINKAYETFSYTDCVMASFGNTQTEDYWTGVLDTRVKHYFFFYGSRSRQYSLDAVQSYINHGSRYIPGTLASQQMWNTYKACPEGTSFCYFLSRGGNVVVYGNLNDGVSTNWINGAAMQSVLRKYGKSIKAQCIYDSDASRSTHVWYNVFFDGIVGLYEGIYATLGI